MEVQPMAIKEIIERQNAVGWELFYDAQSKLDGMFQKFEQLLALEREDKIRYVQAVTTLQNMIHLLREENLTLRRKIEEMGRYGAPQA